MKVKALRLGFIFNKRVYEGDIFEVPEELFSKRWMEKVEEKKELVGEELIEAKEVEVKAKSKSRSKVNKDVL